MRFSRLFFRMILVLPCASFLMICASNHPTISNSGAQLFSGMRYAELSFKL